MRFLTAFFFTCTVDASSPRPRTSCQVGTWSAEESGTNKALPASTPFFLTNKHASAGMNTHASIHQHQWMSALKQAQGQVTSRCLALSIQVEQHGGSFSRCTSALPQCTGRGTYSIYSLSNLYYFSKLIVSVSHGTRAEVWENAPSGKPVYSGWTIRDGVWQTASHRGDLPARMHYTWHACTPHAQAASPLIHVPSFVP